MLYLSIWQTVNQLLLIASENSYLQERWLSDERFKDWLVPTHTKREARCKRCKKSFALSNLGIQTLKSHAEGKNTNSYVQLWQYS